MVATSEHGYLSPRQLYGRDNLDTAIRLRATGMVVDPCKKAYVPVLTPLTTRQNLGRGSRMTVRLRLTPNFNAVGSRGHSDYRTVLKNLLLGQADARQD